MLDWYAEDYLEFVKECENNLKSLELDYKNSIINGLDPPAGNSLIKLAKNQVIIAKFMAIQAS